ncbi:hypothetical protein LJC14_06335, partial [Treponema sp. OttesenSCG-928-L16]|nr:hypothetical protein [Treponema sp. OttesenSCG-928-L16]
MKNAVIGIDIGGTRCKAGIVDLLTGNVSGVEVFPTEKKDGTTFFSTLESKIRKLEKFARREKIVLTGIGTGVLTYVYEDNTLD